MNVDRLDHFVLTVRDIAATAEFYFRVLGMREVVFGAGRIALAFGTQKINLHQLGLEIEPKAALPSPGAADLCLLTTTPLAEVVDHLKKCDVSILLGPVSRTGAIGLLASVYIRDPDGNLIEISNPVEPRG